jgi:hypothetical protein
MSLICLSRFISHPYFFVFVTDLFIRLDFFVYPASSVRLDLFLIHIFFVFVTDLFIRPDFFCLSGEHCPSRFISHPYFFVFVTDLFIRPDFFVYPASTTVVCHSDRKPSTLPLCLLS